ncbi:MAG: TolC family protein [Methylococcaceae bacterium]|nr:TolC family protein [Methylococcaceae bacterium]
MIEHLDELVIDDRLTLRQVVDTTFERYPQNALISAFQEESKALEQRSSSWIAGYPMIYLQYIDDALLGRDDGITNVQSGYQVPLWMWGQKAASQKITEESKQAAEHYIVALKHEVAGLVRDALWTLRLMENRRELARQIYEVAEKLTAVVRRRVELGDLARADELLAESDQLEKKTALVQAEAEVMHARKAYQNLTRMNRAPKRLEEMLSKLKGLDERHPSLAASSASVERAQAEVEFTRLSKQGNQPTILVGTDSTQIDRQGSFGTGTNIVLQVPIGGDDWHAPQVAQANLTLNEKIVQRETLRRQLEKALHEAQHTLEVDRAALDIAERRKAIAETQISMSRIAFEAGEVALIDYLKIQSGAQSAIRDAAERAILVQKDTSVYNQVVGVMP